MQPHNRDLAKFPPLEPAEKILFASYLIRVMANDQADEVMPEVLAVCDVETGQRVAKATSRWCKEVSGLGLRPKMSSDAKEALDLPSSSMTDASKRLHSPPPSDGGYEVVSAASEASSPARFSPTTRASRPTRRGGDDSFTEAEEPAVKLVPDGRGGMKYNLNIPATPRNGVQVPRDVGTMLKWSKVLFVCPKYKDRRLSYAELLALALRDKDVLSYVAWAQQRYAGNIPEPGKISDFVAYANAVDFRGRDYTASANREYKEP